VEFAYKTFTNASNEALFQDESAKEEFVKHTLDAANVSYRNLVDMVLRIQMQDLDVSKKSATQTLTQDYLSLIQKMLDKTNQTLANDKILPIVVLNLLARLKGPISLRLFERLALSYLAVFVMDVKTQNKLKSKEDTNKKNDSSTPQRQKEQQSKPTSPKVQAEN
jgi:hypothetical protein